MTFPPFVQGFGLKGRKATVELLVRPEGDEKSQPKVIETARDSTIREDGVPVEVRFRQTPTVAGGFEFFVRAKPPAGVRELSDEDNERRKTVNVIDRKLHVLLDRERSDARLSLLAHDAQPALVDRRRRLAADGVRRNSRQVSQDAKTAPRRLSAHSL